MVGHEEGDACCQRLSGALDLRVRLAELVRGLGDGLLDKWGEKVSTAGEEYGVTVERTFGR